MNTTISQLLNVVGEITFSDFRDNPRLRAVWDAYKGLPASLPELKTWAVATRFNSSRMAGMAIDDASDALPQEGLGFAQMQVRDLNHQTVGWYVLVHQAGEQVGWL